MRCLPLRREAALYHLITGVARPIAFTSKPFQGLKVTTPTCGEGSPPFVVRLSEGTRLFTALIIHVGNAAPVIGWYFPREPYTTAVGKSRVQRWLLYSVDKNATFGTELEEKTATSTP